MTIIVCGDWSDFHRFLPTVRGEGVGAATPEFGTVTYVTPKIKEMGFDAGEFLRHELSHAVLLQNAGLWKALRLTRQAWLLEGLAVLAGDQHAYGSRADLVKWTRAKSLLPLVATQPYTKPGFELRAAYLAWRYFNEWIIAERGRPLFQELIKAFIDQPANIEPAFARIYGEDLAAAVRRFESTVRSETAP
jgi:hypothetical protein